MLLFPDLKEKVEKKISSVLAGINSKDFDWDQTGHSDFSLRCFRLAKPDGYGKICDAVRNVLSSDAFIDRIECQGPYINIKVRGEAALEIMRDEIERAGIFPDTFQDPERILVEHTSTNPTGPLHIGRARNSILGDSLAKLMARMGYRVSTQYFVNDSGRQVMGMVEGFRRYGNGDRTLKTILSCYQKIYSLIDKDPEIRESVENLSKKYEEGDENTIREVKETCSVVLDSIRSSLLRLGIKIDDYVWESGFLRGGETESVIEMLSEYIQNEDGAVFITGDDGKKIYLKRKDGTTIYFLRDLAYHLFKALNADWIIDVMGEDHKGHARALSHVLINMLEYRPRLDFVFNSFVSLETGKMSTRGGNIVTLDEVMDRSRQEAELIVREKRKDLESDRLGAIAEAVGISSVRFNILRIGAEKAMVFRWKDALNVEGNSAPFIMYSYARASGILKHEPDAMEGELRLDEKEERDLVMKMYRYPYVLRAAMDSLKPEYVCNYLLELVNSFSAFYSSVNVIKSEEKNRNTRFLILHIYKKILEDACEIAGIRLLEEM